MGKGDIKTRVETLSHREVAVISPVTGKKKIVDFGFDLKRINMMVYSTEGINKGNPVNIFSKEFSGSAIVEQISTAEYSGTPYSIANISAVAEDHQPLQSNSGKGIYSFTGLERVYSILYSTTHVENIGTGVNFAISAKGLHDSPVISFGFGGKTYRLGIDGGKRIGTGSNISRTTKSYTSTFADPLSVAMQKMVIFSTISADNSRFISELKRSNHIVHFTLDEADQFIRETVNKGDIGGFVSRLLEGSGISIDASLAKRSPIVAALASTTGEASARFKNLFYSQVYETWFQGTIISIGALLGQVLPIFGLELYYQGGGKYSLEPPRYIFFDEHTKSHIAIDYNDVISITTEEPRINVPSAIIPAVDFKNMALTAWAQRCSEIFASKVAHAMSKIVKAPVFKIETYEIPNILMPDAEKLNKNSLFERINGQFANIWKYYSSLAFKSAFHKMNVGTIELFFHPDIVEPHKWYKVGSDWYYITDISHSLQRGSAVTSLRYAGRYDKELYGVFKQALHAVSDAKSDCAEQVKGRLDDVGAHTPINKDSAPKKELELHQDKEHFQ